ncbi:C40 family peptidase [Sphingobacterium paludis]|uniref:NlpC/P60 family protein n=1 Tax=Sphingobacterium paludis TaxID=1476465 RepID=A0A4R7D6T7_9SPHI|nr:C40 family peptidase [Sphingobacterium paludis]TDS16092.1 NlpC/P60 family protein [Sphingobacterium paludis]
MRVSYPTVKHYILVAILFVFPIMQKASALEPMATAPRCVSRPTPMFDSSPEQELIAFAKKLLGVKYRYGASSPSNGFDCSGFVHYVFKRFGVALPRSSSAMGQAGEDVSLTQAKAGDIILFTGTNPARRSIGHVGIVLSNSMEGGLRFIHASSGKAQAVTETTLEGSYKKRFMKVVRVTPS